MRIFYGSNDLNSPGLIDTAIVSIEKHNSFAFPFNRALRADIALIKVDRNIIVNTKTRIMASSFLATKGDFSVDKECMAAGWGWTEDEASPSLLREIKLPIRFKKGSNGCVVKGRQSPADVLCAYNKSGSTCKGDSGGPLFCPSVSNEPLNLQFGILSSTRKECRQRGFVQFIDVKHYYSWIESTRKKMQTENECPYVEA